jgi:hypothetical protein
MTVLAPSHRRPRLPLILISSLFVLLSVGTIAVVQLYWSSLRIGIEQMRASVAAAQREQQRLIEQVRTAEAALQARAEALTAQADEGQGTGAEQSLEVHSGPSDRAVTTRPSAEVASSGAESLRRGLTPQERLRLADRLDALGREAVRLPAARGRFPVEGTDPVTSKRLLGTQLAVARAAASAGDVTLLDAALFAAARLAGPPYRSASGRERQLRAALLRLRAALREPAGDERPDPTTLVAPAVAPPR